HRINSRLVQSSQQPDPLTLHAVQRHADLRLFLYVLQQLALDERPRVRQRQPPNVESGQQVIIDSSVRRDEVCGARQGVAHNLNLQIVAGTESEAVRRRLEP